MAHIPVLLNEVMENLNIRQNGNYVDATLGGGGYTKEILKRNEPNGKVLAIDQNEQAIREVKEKIRQIGFNNWVLENNASKAFPHSESRNEGRPEARSYEESEPHTISGPGSAEGRLILRQGNFSDIQNIVLSSDINNIKGVVFDLGLSTDLLEFSGRGFSYMKDEPLIMTYSEEQAIEGGLTARNIINTWNLEDLTNIFKDYGEERYSRRIAKNIIEHRKKEQIKTTVQLRSTIEGSVGGKSIKTLSRIFQALRIAVNNELNVLQEGIEGAWELTDRGGRIAVVSFHSLEDRIVKNFFRNKGKELRGIIITKKPIGPIEEEEMTNPKSRSAKLRVIEKIS
jgi:16S rRNA (cytosine1402-N4)-methyltransferase